MCEEDGNVVIDDDFIWEDGLNWNLGFLGKVSEWSKEFFDKFEDNSIGDEGIWVEGVSEDYGSIF